MLFDLNGFKAYNDTYGHPAGDALLARLGEALAGAVDGEGERLPDGRRRVLRACDHPDRAPRRDRRREPRRAERARRRLPHHGRARQRRLRPARAAIRPTPCASPTAGCTPRRTGAAPRRAARARPCCCGSSPSAAPTSASTSTASRCWPSRSPRRSAWATSERDRGPAGRRAARHRQGRHPGRDPRQARPARRRRVGVHAPPHHHRRADHAGRPGPARARAARPLVARALRRHRLPRRARRRGDPARRPHHRRLRRLRRHGLRPRLPARRCPHDAAVAELRRCAGTQFDPDVVGAFSPRWARTPSPSWPGAISP